MLADAHCGDQMVDQDPLIEVQIAGLSGAVVEAQGQLGHVVAVAGLQALAGGDHGREVVRRIEMLGDGVGPDGDCALVHYPMPEGVHGFAEGLVSGDLGQTLVAQDLGYLRIGVQAGQLVLACGQRFEEGAVGQATGLVEIAVLSGQLIEAGEGLVQSPVLAGQHGLEILFVDIVRQVAPPVGQAQDHDAGHFGGTLGLDGLPAVQQAGEELVQVVEGHPGAQQIEGLGLNVTLPQVLEEFGAVRHAAQEAVGRGLLALEQAGQHAGGALQEGPGLQTLPVGRQSGKVVAADVAVQTHGLPVGVWIRLGGQTCLAPVGGQKTIGVQAQQVV